MGYKTFYCRSKKYFNFPFDDGCKDKLRKIPENQNRSMAGQVQTCIDRDED